MRITPAQRRAVKTVIEEIEYYDNMFHKTCDGNHVEVVNIRVDKEEKKIHYDATVHRPQDSPSKQRFDDCWTDFDSVIRNANVLDDPSEVDFLKE